MAPGETKILPLKYMTFLKNYTKKCAHKGCKTYLTKTKPFQRELQTLFGKIVVKFQNYPRRTRFVCFNSTSYLILIAGSENIAGACGNRCTKTSWNRDLFTSKIENKIEIENHTVIDETIIENVQRDSQYGQIRAYLLLGKDLFNEMDRNRFTYDDNLAEVLHNRCSAFIEGLVIISRNITFTAEIVVMT